VVSRLEMRTRIGGACLQCHVCKIGDFVLEALPLTRKSAPMLGAHKNGDPKAAAISLKIHPSVFCLRLHPASCEAQSGEAETKQGEGGGFWNL
jgi:hypothetical protein